jgi:anti-sigma regulatory factor (Ser/Thr protein kinase)
VRQSVTDVLNHWGYPNTLIDDVVLIASELASNAIKHGRCEHFEVLIERRDTTVYLAVSDESPEHPKIRHKPQGETGRGMIAIDAISKEWGIRTINGQPYKWVWALLGP